jgi:hypothetical protein
MQPAHFKIVRRFATGEIDIGDNASTYGDNTIEWSPTAVINSGWGKHKLTITSAGVSRNYRA